MSLSFSGGWKAVHASECDVNHYDLSGPTEMETAVQLWQCSEKCKSCYTILLSEVTNGPITIIVPFDCIYILLF
jgi:hypothetical protein